MFLEQGYYFRPVFAHSIWACTVFFSKDPNVRYGVLYHITILLSLIYLPISSRWSFASYYHQIIVDP